MWKSIGKALLKGAIWAYGHPDVALKALEVIKTTTGK